MKEQKKSKSQNIRDIMDVCVEEKDPWILMDL